LIHGGLRYLEHYEFRLVREALNEREVLLKAAPHIIRPLRFVMPHVASLRPAWMIRLGLFLYDMLPAKMSLRKSGSIDLTSHRTGNPLKPAYQKGFVYSDCRVDDSRLVIINAMDAAEHGAKILTRCSCINARRDEGEWIVTLRHSDGSETTERAKVLINAAGPWAGTILEDQIKGVAPQPLRLVKGSHMVVPKMFNHDRAYIFQNDDKRIIFAIPYEEDFTMIGTTDEDYQGDPVDAVLEDDEATYLCKAINGYFEKQISPQDAVWSFSGVRPLYGPESKDASKVSRDYVLEFDRGQSTDKTKNPAPLLNVFSGKITTYRKLAEHALKMMKPFFPHMKPAWTIDVPLPGGGLPNETFETYLSRMSERYSFLSSHTLRRMARAYGSRLDKVLGDATSVKELGACYGRDLYDAEVQYLVNNEWAMTAEDILWRRSKLGLRLSPQDVDKLSNALSFAMRQLN
jgi:glycerol-3-phosphate dehydrogenase